MRLKYSTLRLDFFLIFFCHYTLQKHNIAKDQTKAIMFLTIITSKYVKFITI